MHTLLKLLPGALCKTWCKAQGIRDNTFASYDYGCSCLRILGIGLCSTLICENKAKYGSFDPPAFPIADMVYPRTGFYNGAQDTLATKTDINKLRAGLPDGTIVYDNAIDFGHIDFTWGYNAHENVYDDLIAQIQLYEVWGEVGTAATEPNKPTSHHRWCVIRERYDASVLLDTSIVHLLIRRLSSRVLLSRQPATFKVSWNGSWWYVCYLAWLHHSSAR
ncbi:unnamed protein product [Phytophthora lilii]|uniref:Unnamed protein product n=1 Tax=Phytophthora lilii TaxID=2077276 RepID=A0A9W6X6P6_9STRA|nr:unnamed protein product [Phytophthora lilii]